MEKKEKIPKETIKEHRHILNDFYREQSFRLLVKSVKDYAIYMLDINGYVMSWNDGAENIKGYKANEIIGQHFSCFYTKEDKELNKPENNLETVKKEGHCESEGWRLRKNGSRFWASVTISPIKNDNNEMVGFAKVTRDMTERVELQEALKKSEMMSALGTLVAGVAHEVRNPLFSMTATLDAFEETFPNHPEYKEYLDILRNELTRLTSLMKDLLEYGKPSNQKLLESTIEPVITSSIKACEQLAKEKKVKISYKIKENLPLVLLEENRLFQVFQNLLDNAINHSPANAVVRIIVNELTEDNLSWIEIIIQDSGSGFNEEDLPRVFEPFFSHRPGGTGLGLPIVQKILEQHQGKIFLGNHPSGGARVKVLIPIKK
jgi:PAS domain S-box-containing protein